jgi:hypothetical protein
MLLDLLAVGHVPCINETQSSFQTVSLFPTVGTKRASNST